MQIVTSPGKRLPHHDSLLHDHTKLLPRAITRETASSEVAALIAAVRDATMLYRPMSRGAAKLDVVKCSGFVQRYLASDMHINGSLDVARLSIGGEVFMSTCPMEIESHQLPIALAKGDVLVGGLGMGYYVQQILDKEKVRSVTVVEKEPGVIALYKVLFGSHPKLSIIQGSMFNFKSQTHYDFAYIDLWPDLDIDRVCTDMRLVAQQVTADRYFAWGTERLVFEELSKRVSIEAAFDRFSWDLGYVRDRILRSIMHHAEQTLEKNRERRNYVPFM